MKNYFSLFISFCLLLSSNLAISQFSPGEINKINIDTDKGAMIINLPSDICAGDMISGTVIYEPSGKRKKKKKNLNYLETCKLVVDDLQYDLQGDLVSFAIPQDYQKENLNLKVLDQKGKALYERSIPVYPDTSPELHPEFCNLGIPRIIEHGVPAQIIGPFDGQLQNTNVSLDGIDMHLLAESPRSLYFDHVGEKFGAQDVFVSEGPMMCQDIARAINVELSATKLNLKRGESTDISITVSGLDYYDIPLPLEILNHSPHTLRLDGGAHQTIEIDPSEVPDSGIWSKTLSGESIMTGNFVVEVILQKPESALIIPDFPVNISVDSHSFEFRWTAINLPENSVYDFRLWEMDGESIPGPIQLKKTKPILESLGLTSNTIIYPDDFGKTELNNNQKYIWSVKTSDSAGYDRASPSVSFLYDLTTALGGNGGPKDPCEDPEYVKKEEAKCADLIRYDFETPLNDIRESFNTFKQDWQDYFRMLTRTMIQFDLDLSMVKYWLGVGEEIDQQAQKVQKLAGLVKKGVGMGKTAYKKGGEEAMKKMAKDFAEDKVKEFEQSAVSSVSETAGALYDLEDLAIRRIGLGIAKGITGVYPDKMADHYRRRLQISTTSLMEWVDNRYNRSADPPHPTLQQGIRDMCSMLNQLDKIEEDFKKAVEEAGFICIECEIPRHLLKEMASLRNEIESHIRMFGDTIDQVRQRIMEARAIIRNKDAYEDVSRLGSAQGNIKKWTEEIDRVMSDSESQMKSALATRR